MILSRIAKALREQNWIAVAIEFVIVILGVVIGFQITAWNATRNAVALEQTYLERLHDDMVRSRSVLENEIARSREWHEDANAIRVALLTGDREAAGTGWQLNAATRLVVGSPQMGTLNELISGRQMNLIRDPDLRRRIAQTDAALRSYADYISLMSNNAPPFGYTIQTRLQTATDDPENVTFDFDVLAEDEEFLNALGHMLRLSSVNRYWLEGMLAEVNELEAALAEVLDIEPAP
ncbi:hypothetical protein L5876_08545 [Hyphobacterium sp. SN044]|uniref:hypothetical protein n=1 Tax=Hyphobacterium sp. SN044 TaxID=2912575 RepID=UPI001F18F9F2|nr:hypothetical protein [Hyphobacterium sp. SN044]MCF8879859.1 hypothetical protein [Hyphobacterium sp. SN044]